MGRSSRQKINKEAVAWHGTLGQMNLTDLYKTFHPKAKEKKKRKKKQKNAHSSQVHMELPQK